MVSQFFVFFLLLLAFFKIDNGHEELLRKAVKNIHHLGQGWMSTIGEGGDKKG